jgi:very-short-patch-repair endonuclease
MRPTPEEVLLRNGGFGTAADLVGQCGRSALDSALGSGHVVRLSRGCYALVDTPEPQRSAARLSGVVSHLSAADLWGLQIAHRRQRPEVTVRRGRVKVLTTEAIIHWADLRPDEVADGVTTPVRTVLDCARTLPFREALCVADSALRLGLVGSSELTASAEGLRGAGRRRIIRVAENAHPGAASALESILRGLVLDAGLTTFQPQLRVESPGLNVRLDLGDPDRMIALEADGFEYHGGRTALARDCRRYDELVVRGWLVLRFAWEQLMFEPEWVTSVVQRATTCR